MEKLAQAGEGGGHCKPTPFILFAITYKVSVYAPAQRADTLTVFHLYPYVLCVAAVAGWREVSATVYM